MHRLTPSGAASWGLFPALIACCLTGCGGDGTNAVSGKVTFKDSPIPAGKIYFMPDGAKGNSGPTGYADIKDGVYSTAAQGGKGAVSGPVIVAIEGFDPATPAKAAKGDTSGEVTVKALFPQYRTTADLPAAVSTQDFKVPAEAALRKDQGERPIIVP